MFNIKSNNVLKNLNKGKKRISCRNNNGRITVRRRGGGHKRLYKKINFNVLSPLYKVLSNEYDPNRNATISVIKCLVTGSFDYILSTKDIKVGSIISNKGMMFGGRYKLKYLPSNYLVSNVEFKPKKGGQVSRSSGSFCKILRREKNKVLLRLPSLEERFVNVNCRATIGPIKNNFYHIKKLKKAGNARWLGRRPSVRGVAMNPVDHPHGGGEGKTSGGRVSVSPWGRLAIGKRTRSKKNRTNNLIYKRRKQF